MDYKKDLPPLLLKEVEEICKKLMGNKSRKLRKNKKVAVVYDPQTKYFSDIMIGFTKEMIEMEKRDLEKAIFLSQTG